MVVTKVFVYCSISIAPHVKYQLISMAGCFLAPIVFDRVRSYILLFYFALFFFGPCHITRHIHSHKRQRKRKKKEHEPKVVLNWCKRSFPLSFHSFIQPHRRLLNDFHHKTVHVPRIWTNNISILLLLGTIKICSLFVLRKTKRKRK